MSTHWILKSRNQVESRIPWEVCHVRRLPTFSRDEAAGASSFAHTAKGGSHEQVRGRVYVDKTSIELAASERSGILLTVPTEVAPAEIPAQAKLERGTLSSGNL